MKAPLVLLIASSILCPFVVVHGQGEEEGPKNKILRDKIKRIEIPKVNFFEVPLTEAVNVFMDLSRKNDFAEPDPDRKGVNLITMLQGEPAPVLTLQLNKMSLEKMLDFITEMVGWTYEVREDAIVVSKEAPRKGIPHGLKVEFFEVPQSIIQRMTGGGGGAPPDPFSGGAVKPLDQAGEVKQSLANAGVRFDEKKGHKFVFDGFQIIATHDQESLDRIRAILLELDQDVISQIGVDFKVLEAPLGFLDKIIGETVGPGYVKGTQIENRLAEKVLSELVKQEEVNLNFAPRLVILDGQPASMTIGEEMIYPTDFKAPDAQTASDVRNNSTGHGASAQFGKVAPDDEQPGFREVGIQVDLTPRFESKYDRIHLELFCGITEFLGFSEYGPGIKVPKFWSWKLVTSVMLRRHHSIIFRGPASEGKREIIIFLQASAFR